MAMVNQKTGERQGNASYVLYPLAAQSAASCTSNAAAVGNSSCIFYDVVTGNNSVACVGGSPNCSNTNSASGQYGIMVYGSPASAAWTTTPGYDLATGLGSVNAANLVKNWTSVSFAPTTTTLSLSTTPATNPITLTHGQPVSVSIQVAPKSGAGTPTGDLSLIAQTSNSQGTSPTTGIGSFALNKGSFSGATNMLPGGTYGVTAHYAGDGTYGASDSTPPVQVTVSAENSQTRVALLTFNPVTGQETSSNATSVVYGSPYLMRVDVTNSSGEGCFSVPYACPTGEVWTTDNGVTFDAGSYKLNSQGYTENQSIQLRGGAHNLGANYSGNSSYNASISPTDAITITPAPTTTALSVPSSTLTDNFTITAVVNTQSYGGAPTGYVQFLANGSPIGSAVYVSGTPYWPSTRAFATAQAGVSRVVLPAGTVSLTAQYGGDPNYAGSTSSPTTISVTDFSLSANPSAIALSSSVQSASSTITITPLNGFTGLVTLYPDSPMGILCKVPPMSYTVTGSSPITATLTCTLTAPISATPPTAQPRVPPSLRLPTALPWLLAGLLAMVTLVSLATAQRRPAAWLFLAALLVMGVWAACGGGGGGGGPPPTPAPVVNLSSGTLAFDQQNMHTSSAALAEILFDTGNATLSISTIAISGTNSGDFAQTNNCGSSVGAGANCTISVTFTPTATGPRSASLTITDNASDSPQTIGLTGTGFQPAISLLPVSLTFGPEGVGLTSPPQTVTLLNAGDSLMTIFRHLHRRQ